MKKATIQICILLLIHIKLFSQDLAIKNEILLAPIILDQYTNEQVKNERLNLNTISTECIVALNKFIRTRNLNYKARKMSGYPKWMEYYQATTLNKPDTTVLILQPYIQASGIEYKLKFKIENEPQLITSKGNPGTALDRASVIARLLDETFREHQEILENALVTHQKRIIATKYMESSEDDGGDLIPFIPKKIGFQRSIDSLNKSLDELDKILNNKNTKPGEVKRLLTNIQSLIRVSNIDIRQFQVDVNKSVYEKALENYSIILQEHDEVMEVAELLKLETEVGEINNLIPDNNAAKKLTKSELEFLQSQIKGLENKLDNSTEAKNEAYSNIYKKSKNLLKEIQKRIELILLFK